MEWWKKCCGRRLLLLLLLLHLSCVPGKHARRDWRGNGQGMRSFLLGLMVPSYLSCSRRSCRAFSCGLSKNVDTRICEARRKASDCKYMAAEWRSPLTHAERPGRPKLPSSSQDTKDSPREGHGLRGLPSLCSHLTVLCYRP